MECRVRTFLAISKALSDETRVRALLSLREGELCLCQIIELLGLAPSTVSKHMDVLYQAGLVERRKEGRWHYFRLASRNGRAAEAGAEQTQAALRWVLAALAGEPTIRADAKRLCCVRKMDRQEASACYREN